MKHKITSTRLGEGERACRAWAKAAFLVAAWVGMTQADAGFAVDTNRVTLIAAGGPPTALPLQSKLDVGRALVDWLERRRETLA